MRSDRERIESMHRRAALLRRRTERRSLYAWGGSVAVFAICLVALTAVGYHGHGMAADASTASSLLADSAGGYVLVGVLAFMLGIFIAVALKNRKKR